MTSLCDDVLGVGWGPGRPMIDIEVCTLTLRVLVSEDGQPNIFSPQEVRDVDVQKFLNKWA